MSHLSKNTPRENDFRSERMWMGRVLSKMVPARDFGQPSEPVQVY